MRTIISRGLAALLVLAISPMKAVAAEGSESGVLHIGESLTMIGLLVLLGLAGGIVARFRQPEVMGELLVGMAVAGFALAGWEYVSEMRVNPVVAFWAGVGAVILLLSVGLESNIQEMLNVGVSAAKVAIVGMLLPGVMGYLLGMVVFSGASQNAKLYLAASMVATSVGITASVLQARNLSRTKMGQTVIGAGVIDDVGGLIILALVSAMSTSAAVSWGMAGGITLKSVGFLVGSIVIGAMFANPFSTLFSKFSNRSDTKLVVTVSLALLFGGAAEWFGLEPIIGAFAVGLALDPVKMKQFLDPELITDLLGKQFRDNRDQMEVQAIIRRHQHMHLESLVLTVSRLFVPVFFVRTGMMVDFGSLLKPELYFAALVITVAAIAGKMLAGLVADGSLSEKLLVGSAMVPRGEVGLIFAASGRSIGALSDEMFSVIVLMVIVTTFISPAMIGFFVSRLKRESEVGSYGEVKLVVNEV